MYSNKIRISSELQALAISPFIQQIQYHLDKSQIIVMLSEVQAVGCWNAYPQGSLLSHL